MRLASPTTPLPAGQPPARVVNASLPVPTGLAAVGGNGSVTVTWNAMGAMVYQVQRSPDNSNWTDVAQTAAPTYTETSQASVRWYFRVRSTNGVVFSAYSASVNASPYLIYATFTAADNTPLENYTPEVGPQGVADTGTWQITSNKAVRTTSGGGEIFVWDAGAGQFDGTLTVDLNSGDNTAFGFIGCIFHYKDDSNYWEVQLLDSSNVDPRINVYEKSGGTFSPPRATANFAVVDNTVYTMELDIQGTTLTVKVNGVAQCSYNTMATGLTEHKYGIIASQGGQSTRTFDNLKFVGPPHNPYFIGNLDTVYRVEIGSQLVIMPVVTSDFGGVQTYSVQDDTVNFTRYTQRNDLAFVKSGLNTFTYAPIDEDAGTIRFLTFKVTDGTHTATVNVKVATIPLIGTQHPSNPLVPYSGTGYLAGADTMWPSDRNVVNDVAYVLSTTKPDFIDQSNNNIFQWTSTRAGAFLDFAQGTGNPRLGQVAHTWEDHAINGPTHVFGPATGGPLAGKYFWYYSAQDDVNGESGVGVSRIGMIYADGPDGPVYTKYSGNPVIVGNGDPRGPSMSIPRGYQLGTRVYLTVLNGDPNGGIITLYTADLSDPTVCTQRSRDLIQDSVGDWDAGTAKLDPFPHRNLYGFLEAAYTAQYNVGGVNQAVGYVVSADALPDTNFQYGFIKKIDAPFLLPSLTNTGPTAWYEKEVGDAAWWSFENTRYFYSAGITAAQLGGTPWTGGTIGVWRKQSATTGMFLGERTTAYASGNTVYPDRPPNGFTPVDIDAVPASGTCDVTPSAYSTAGALLSVVGSNGVDISFLFHGLSPQHVYQVLVNGVNVGNFNTNINGVGLFSGYTAWTGSDTVIIQ